MPKRRRPRVWDDAQVIAWIVHRIGRAVNDAKGMLKAVQDEWKVIDAKEGKLKKASLAFQLAILFEYDNPYSADGTPTARNVARRYAKAEKEFEAAIAKGRLKRRGKNHWFNDKEVKTIWPGSGRGNSKKPFFNRALVYKAAAIIACGTDGQTRSEVFRDLGPKGFAKQKKQSALLRAATDTAIHYLKSGEPPSTEPPSIEWGHLPEWEIAAMPSVEGEHPLVTTPSEAKELSARDNAAPESARESLKQLARTKQLLPRERKAQLRHVKAFKKRTLQDSISASN